MREMLGWDSDAVVPDGYQHVGAVTLCRQVDLPAVVRVFGRVVEQVREDLSEAGQVGIEEDRIFGQGDGQAMARLAHERRAGLHCALHHLAQGYLFPSERDL